MTNQEINKAIAETCGWNQKSSHFGGSEGIWTDPSGIDHTKFPDYCSDLNAIQKVVKAMPDHLKDTYIDWLYDLSVNLCSSQKESEFDLSNASAKTRCEAYLKALGKWEVE